jgi:K+-transporting ATPase ATPase B chain
MDRDSQAKAKVLKDTRILKTAIVDSFRKLHPRTMIKNPVMFVVEVGALLTSIQLVRDTLNHAGQFGFGLQITVWLWFTVLFANFAEAMAEGRGKAQAETLRKARAETEARRLRADNSIEVVSSSKLRSCDVVLVAAGEFVPGDGEVI